MTDRARIVLDLAVLAGKPVIRGTRLSVDFVIGLMANGWTEADILRNYPRVSHDDIAACLAYARDVLRSKKIVSERRVRCAFSLSQRSKQWLDAEMFRGVACLRGMECRKRYAEAFFARKLAGLNEATGGQLPR